MCKHVAAVLYGIGARLDEKPELLFILRGVDHAELVTEDVAKAVVTKVRKTGRRTLAESELSEVFGIDVASAPPARATADPVDAEAAGANGRRSSRSSRASKRQTIPPAIAKRIRTRKTG
jgi:uncharacterized Zn finger protein